MDVNTSRLYVNEGDEEFIPKGSLDIDSKYFDLDSLVRLYGKDRVERLLGYKLYKDQSGMWYSRFEKV